MPHSIESIDGLERLLTGIIFVSSVQHAVEGNPAFDILGNPAHHPFTLRKPPPTEVITYCMLQYPEISSRIILIKYGNKY